MRILTLFIYSWYFLRSTIKCLVIYQGLAATPLEAFIFFGSSVYDTYLYCDQVFTIPLYVVLKCQGENFFKNFL